MTFLDFTDPPSDLQSSNFKAVALTVCVGFLSLLEPVDHCIRPPHAPASRWTRITLLNCCYDRHAPNPFQSKHETTGRFPWRVRLQNAHNQSICVELQATKLGPALPVGARGGARYGFHALRGTWHIRALPAAIKPPRFRSATVLLSVR